MKKTLGILLVILLLGACTPAARPASTQPEIPWEITVEPQDLTIRHLQQLIDDAPTDREGTPYRILLPPGETLPADDTLRIPAGKNILLLTPAGEQPCALLRGPAWREHLVIVRSGGTLELENLVVDGGEMEAEGAAVRNLGWLTLGEGAVVQHNHNAITGEILYNYGGGIHNRGRLVLEEGSLVQKNRAGQEMDMGGGIYNLGELELRGGEIRDNTARLSGGGVANVKSENTVDESRYTPGLLIVDGGKIAGNTALEYPGGGGGVYSRGTLYLHSGGVTENTAAGSGGGIQAEYGEFHMLGGGVADNNADMWGGGISLSGMNLVTFQGGEISDNQAGASGGGIYLSPYGMHFAVELRDITIRENLAKNHGGGIYSGAALTVGEGAALYGNRSWARGGGVYTDLADFGKGTQGSLTLSGGEIRENRAMAGGGVYAEGNFIYNSGTLWDNGASEGENLCTEKNYQNLSGQELDGVYQVVPSLS